MFQKNVPKYVVGCWIDVSIYSVFLVQEVMSAPDVSNNDEMWHIEINIVSYLTKFKSFFWWNFDWFSNNSSFINTLNRLRTFDIEILVLKHIGDSNPNKMVRKFVCYNCGQSNDHFSRNCRVLDQQYTRCLCGNVTFSAVQHKIDCSTPNFVSTKIGTYELPLLWIITTFVLSSRTSLKFIRPKQQLKVKNTFWFQSLWTLEQTFAYDKSMDNQNS